MILIAPAAHAVVLVPQAPLTDGGPTRVCAWPINYPGSSNYAWPDTHAAYFVQAALISKGESIEINGRDPKARFWSITTYDYENRAVIDRVNDTTVKRTGKSWTVMVAPVDRAKDPNWLKGAPPYVVGDPLDAKKLTVIIYRVYLGQGNTAGGTLPTVTLHQANGTSELLSPCTKAQIGPPDVPPTLEPGVGVPDQFVRAEGGRFYPSYDTSYLAAQVPYDPSTILVVRGKAPVAGKDVRYWSICEGKNVLPLPVVDCASDSEVKLVKGRYTIAVVGPGQVPAADRKKYPGVTFLNWAAPQDAASVPDAFLLIRHILPAAKFAGSIARVKLGAPATSTMGDYAPVISHVALADLAAS